MAVFVIGSINQSIIVPENSTDLEPTVVSTFPSDGETDVARNIVIEITFSEELDSTALQHSTFTLTQETGPVSGNLDFSGNKMTFTAAENLTAETVYTADIKMADNHTDVNVSDEEFNDEQPEEYPAENGKVWSFTTGGNTGPVEAVDLGSAARYVILAQSAIHNDSTSDITGEKGFDPDFKSSKENKTAYWLKNEDIDKEKVRTDTTRTKSDNEQYSPDERNLNSGNLNEALEDMITAYNDAAERTPVDFIDFKLVTSEENADSSLENGNAYNMESRTNWGQDYTDETAIDGKKVETSITLEPGVYKWNDSIEISTHITLSGSAEDVWIFQISEDLTVNPEVEMALANGAVAENIFWQVAGEVNLGVTSHFEGIILSQTGITMGNGATLNGRLMAQTDVTLDDNTVVDPKILATVQRRSSNN